MCATDVNSEECEMRVFVTGASGWIGSAVVDELLAAGHEVVGLARSDASAAALKAKGVVVRRGDLDDLDGIRAGAGVEWQFRNSPLSIRAEYRYTNYELGVERHQGTLGLAFRF